jgi:CRISPR-associated Cas5-like protein
MEILRADLEVPFWCSFSEYGTVNIRPTYPFPPLTTIFGLIQNALEKPALHNLDKDERKGIARQYLNDYSKLDFGIVIREDGEKIDDYLNVHKGSRVLERKFENDILTNKLKNEIKKLDIPKERKKDVEKLINPLKRKNFVEKLGGSRDEKVNEVLNLVEELRIQELVDLVKDFWKENNQGHNAYEINKKWISSQINRQRLIMPKYTIYIRSIDKNGEYSLENIFNHLKNPKRPLYLGENDDIVDVANIEIIETSDDVTKSSKINSIIPGIYTNCQLVKIPVELKNDITKNKEHTLICSVPEGELDCEISCFEVEGDNIVFLRSNSKE